MQVLVKYSNSQVREAVKFICLHNKCFKGRDTYIRDSIFRHFRELAEMLGYGDRSMSTLGYQIRCFTEKEEGIDFDVNVVRMEVTVDPSLMDDTDERYQPDDVVELNYNFDALRKF